MPRGKNRERARPSGGHRQPKHARKTSRPESSVRPYRPSRKKAYNSARVTPRPTSTSWTLRRFANLSEEQQNTYFRAKRVIDEVRSGWSATRAARNNKTSLTTVQRYFPGDFSTPKGSRRWKVSSSDKHPNEVQFLGKGGYEDFVLRGSREVSRLARYLNDVKKVLRGIDPSAINKWRGRKLGGRKLITNLKLLEKLGEEGKLDFEEKLPWRS
jgi:hypothetical protein